MRNDAAAVAWLEHILAANPQTEADLIPQWQIATLGAGSKIKTPLEALLRDSFWPDQATGAWTVPTLAQREILRRRRAKPQQLSLGLELGPDEQLPLLAEAEPEASTGERATDAPNEPAPVPQEEPRSTAVEGSGLPLAAPTQEQPSLVPQLILASVEVAGVPAAVATLRPGTGAIEWSAEHKSMRFMLRAFRSVLEPLDYSNTNLLEWHIGGAPVLLRIYHRYLCFADESGKLGWVRVGAKTISFPHDGYSPSSDRLTPGWQVTFSAEWDHMKLSKYNLIATFHRPNRKAALILRFQFLPDAVRLIDAEIPDPDNQDVAEARGLLETIRGDREAFDRRLRVLATTPFRYRSPLAGSSASVFFDKCRSGCDLHLTRKDEGLMLIAVPFLYSPFSDGEQKPGASDREN